MVSIIEDCEWCLTFDGSSEAKGAGQPLFYVLLTALIYLYHLPFIFPILKMKLNTKPYLVGSSSIANEGSMSICPRLVKPDYQVKEWRVCSEMTL